MLFHRLSAPQTEGTVAALDAYCWASCRTAPRPQHNHPPGTQPMCLPAVVLCNHSLPGSARVNPQSTGPCHMASSPKTLGSGFERGRVLCAIVTYIRSVKRDRACDSLVTCVSHRNLAPSWRRSWKKSNLSRTWWAVRTSESPNLKSKCPTLPFRDPLPNLLQFRTFHWLRGGRDQSLPISMTVFRLRP